MSLHLYVLTSWLSQLQYRWLNSVQGIFQISAENREREKEWSNKRQIKSAMKMKAFSPAAERLLWRSQPLLSGCPVAISQTAAHSLWHECMPSVLHPNEQRGTYEIKIKTFLILSMHRNSLKFEHAWIYVSHVILQTLHLKDCLLYVVVTYVVVIFHCKNDFFFIRKKKKKFSIFKSISCFYLLPFFFLHHIFQ